MIYSIYYPLDYRCDVFFALYRRGEPRGDFCLCFVCWLTKYCACRSVLLLFMSSRCRARKRQICREKGGEEKQKGSLSLVFHNLCVSTHLKGSQDKCGEPRDDYRDKKEKHSCLFSLRFSLFIFASAL